MRGLRASSYNIYINTPGKPDEMIITNGITGIVEKLAGGVAECLKSNEHYRLVDNIKYCITEEQIFFLLRCGYITRMSVEEEEKHFLQIATNITKSRLKSPPQYCFIVTYNCNFRCVYCYQAGIRSDTKNIHLNNTISTDLIDCIFKALPEFEKRYWNNTHINRKFMFFGGEPLLTKNKKIIKYIIDKGRSLAKSEFSAVTNGYELDAYMDLLNSDNISSLQVTVDGPPLLHNRTRIHSDARKTFEKIAENISLALNRGVEISLRTNVDKTNLHSLHLLADEIVKQKWNEYNNFSAYAGLIHGGNESVNSKNIIDLYGLLNYILEDMKVHPNMAVFQQLERTLILQIQEKIQNKETLMELFKTTYCGAHGSSYIFDMTGNIYSCLETDGGPEYKIGSIDSKSGNFIKDYEKAKLWNLRTVISNDTCKRCPYALFCGGGCAIRAKERNGDMHTNYCNGFKAMFDLCLLKAFEIS